MKLPKRGTKPNPVVVNGWTIEKLPPESDAMYMISAYNIHRQKLTFVFRNKHTAVSFCQMNAAHKIVV